MSRLRVNNKRQKKELSRDYGRAYISCNPEKKEPSTFLRDLFLLASVHEELQRVAEEKETRAGSLTPFCLFYRLCPIDSMFPEGISRYHPQLAPFKAGVAMIASDVSEKKSDICLEP